MKDTSKENGEACADFPLEEPPNKHGGSLAAHRQRQYPLCILRD